MQIESCPFSPPSAARQGGTFGWAGLKRPKPLFAQNLLAHSVSYCDCPSEMYRTKNLLLMLFTKKSLPRVSGKALSILRTFLVTMQDNYNFRMYLICCLNLYQVASITDLRHINFVCIEAFLNINFFTQYNLSQKVCKAELNFLF